MTRNLIFVSLAPIVIVAVYIYIRDKYEKEPILKLFFSLLGGVIIIPAVMITEKLLLNLASGSYGLQYVAYKAFIVASLTEEGFKYLIFIVIIWAAKDFNEKFDGIVYAVFISLGFAAVENLLYVSEGGFQIGLLRAATAVPAHAFFGVSMGYHFGMAKFYPNGRGRELAFALLFPVLWHGFYDFFLMTEKAFLLVMFLPLLVWMWVSGLRKMKELSDSSNLQVFDVARKGCNCF